MTAPAPASVAAPAPAPAPGAVTAGAWYVAIAGLQAAGSLALVPLAAALLAPAQLGLVATAVGTAQLVRSVATAGLPSALTVLHFNRPESRDRSRALITGASALTVGLGLAAAAVLAGMAAVGVDGVGGALVLGALIGTAAGVAQNLQSWSRCWGRVGLYGAATLTTGPAANAVGLVVVALVGGAAAITVLAGWAVAALVGVLVTVAAVPPRSPRAVPVRLVGDALRIGAPTIVHSLATVVLSVGDRYVIEVMIGPAAVGRYHAPYLLASGGVVVAAAASSAWAPHVLGHRPGVERSAALHRSSGLFLLGAAALGGVAGLAAPVVIDLAAGPTYEPAAIRLVAGLVGASAVPFAVYLAAQISLLGSERLSMVAGATVVAAVANLGLNAALIGPLGLDGAATATVASYGLLAALSAAGARRFDPRFAVDGRALAVGSVVAAGAVAVGAGAPVAGVGLVVRVVAAMALAAWLMSAVRRRQGDREGAGKEEIP